MGKSCPVQKLNVLVRVDFYSAAWQCGVGPLAWKIIAIMESSVAVTREYWRFSLRKSEE
jgi:hypothetical protein